MYSQVLRCNAAENGILQVDCWVCKRTRAAVQSLVLLAPVAYCGLYVQGRMQPCQGCGAVLGLKDLMYIYISIYMCVASVKADLSAKLLLQCPAFTLCCLPDAYGTLATSKLPPVSLGHLQSISKSQSNCQNLYMLVVMYGTTVLSQAWGGMDGRCRMCGDKR